MIGQNLSNILLFAPLVDKNDRFAVITTGEKVVQFNHASEVQSI